MKKFIKGLCLVLAMVMIMAPLASFADGSGTNGFDDVLATKGNDTLDDAVKTVGGTVISVVQITGYVVAVIMIVVVGIQWMTAPPAKKAELKGKLWSMAIGATLLVAGVSILKAVTTIATSVVSTVQPVG